MRAFLLSALSLPSIASAHPGDVLHWHGAELLLALLALVALMLYLLRR